MPIIVPEYNIVVCPMEEAERNWPIIVNVSDSTNLSKLGQAGYYWYPINEMSNWGYGPFFWSKKILDQHIARKDKILIHCAAGVHRSPMILYWYLRSLGHTTEEIYQKWFVGKFADFGKKTIEKDIKNRTIPSDLMLMYRIMNDFPTWCLMGVLERLNRLGEH